MVEFALVVPILLALLFGIISYGWMLSYRQALTQAATEGARVAALATGDEDPATVARQMVDASLDFYDITCATSGALMRHGERIGDCVVSTSSPKCVDVSCVSVAITHNYRDHPLIPSFPGLGVTLPSAVTFTSVMESN